MESAAYTDPKPDFSRKYQLARGVSFRRESFGGILYNYRGDLPDPRMVFVPSPFLCGLLERLSQAALGDLVHAAAHKFSLSPGEVQRIEDFFWGLFRQGVIEEHSC